ncbi:hypothetical protein [Rhodocaloribacter sp.]
MLYVVRYTGPFGFIKPWTAVRDGETYSQQFLTPSIIEGIRQKLEVSAILRHRLTHQGFSRQQECVQSAGLKQNAREKVLSRETSILVRGVMLNPTLTLAFPTTEDAERAIDQHLCLCRNEDLVYPMGGVERMAMEDFDQISGFELHFGQGPGSFLVGYNRFEAGAPMYGRLEIVGNPTTADPQEG